MLFYHVVCVSYQGCMLKNAMPMLSQASSGVWRLKAGGMVRGFGSANQWKQVLLANKHPYYRSLTSYPKGGRFSEESSYTEPGRLETTIALQYVEITHTHKCNLWQVGQVTERIDQPINQRFPPFAKRCEDICLVRCCKLPHIMPQNVSTVTSSDVCPLPQCRPHQL